MKGKKPKTPKVAVCPGCGRETKIKGRGVCARCYNYVAKGVPIPPLDTALFAPQEKPAKAKAVVEQPAANPKPKVATTPEPRATEPAYCCEDLGPMPAENDTPDCPEDGQFLINLEAVHEQGLADQDEILQVMSDFAEMARKWARTPEAQLFDLMRRAARVYRSEAA